MSKNPFEKIKRQQDNLVINVNDDGELEIPISSLARQLIGNDGSDGKDGKDGIVGKDGISGRGVKRIFITKDRSLAVEYTDGQKVAVGKILHGKDGLIGKDGIKGLDGSDGADGTHGVGIANAEIDDGHLFLTFTDGKEIDVGNVVGADGTHGKNGGAARGIKNNGLATDNAIVRFDKDSGLASQDSNVTISDTGAITVAGAFTLPTTDGTAGQVLQTDGNGVVVWATVAAAEPETADNRVLEDGNNRVTEDGSNRVTEGS